MDKLAQYAALHDRILHFIKNVPLSPFSQKDAKHFSRLALDVFTWQFNNNTPYARLCKRRSLTPENVKLWRDIPAVTTASFKSLPLFCFEANQAQAIFHTSGTTQDLAGKNYLYNLGIYRTAALRWFRATCLTSDEKILFLVLGPTIPDFPHSSLGHMFRWIVQEFGLPESCIAFGRHGLERKIAVQFLEKQRQTSRPVFILATSLALLRLIEEMQQQNERVSLISGSIILDTGGYKGRQKSINRPEFMQWVAEHFGVPQKSIYNEYGMTEMSSQFYESQPVRAVFGSPYKLAPPWLKSLACDPATLQILPAGSEGVLRHFDLTNLDSVAMLQTEDVGVVHENGIELRGRLPGAESRGCSLLAEELMDADN